MQVTTQQGAVPSAGLEVKKRNSKKNQQKHKILISPTQLYTGLERHLQDRADVGPVGIFVLLICQVTSGLSLHTYLSPPQSLVLLLLQPSLIFIWLERLSACRKGCAGPEQPGTVNFSLELDSFWQLSIAISWDPARPEHSHGLS